MMQGQIDGNIVSAQFILVPRKKVVEPLPFKRDVSPPPKRGDAVMRDPLPRDLKDGSRRRDCTFNLPSWQCLRNLVLWNC